jgi:DNA-binding GntR family transcriptional regulator
LKRMSSVNRAYETIKTGILDNRYPPGYQALEQQLAEGLGMSRTPVREALIRLEQEGLVELVPRRGMRVVPVSAADMREIYEVLTGLETSAIDLLAASCPASDELKPLDAAMQDMENAIARNDLAAWAAADARYHRELLALSGNRRLTAIAAGLNDQVHRARMVTLRLRPIPVQSNAEHRRVLDALKRADWPGARKLHYRHRTRAAGELTGILEQYHLHHL